MNKINHTLPIPKNFKFRFSKDIVFMKAMIEILDFPNFKDYTFEHVLQYLRVQTKLPIVFLRKKLLDIYRELGIIITFDNLIPK
jgi:hypothetical protein